MPSPLIGNAMIKCAFGDAPVPLTVLPANKVLESMPVGNIADTIPMGNIMTFGTCKSMMNPQVIAATAAAFGVLTPMPCIPVTGIPWTPGSVMALIGSMPSIDNTSIAMCTWGGAINVTFAGQVKVSD